MGGARRYVVALEQRRSRLLAPRQGGGVRLRGAVLLSRSPLHPVCRYDEVICSEMTRRDAGAWHVVCLVQMLAPSDRPHPSLRDTFPLEGEGSCGGTIFLCSTS